MKKKLVAIIVAASMAATMLTACGDAPEAGTPAPSSSVPTTSEETTEQSTVEASVEEPAESNMVSDETFAIIQQNYATMREYYDLVAAAYSLDEIAANPEIEAVMSQAADLIAQMGEVKQDMLPEENAAAFNDLIIELVEQLTALAGAMEPAEGAGEAEAGAEGTPVTDETFEIMQQNWASLTGFYDQIAITYNDAVNNGEIERNEEFEALMNQAAEILEQMQFVSKEELTQEKAVELNDAMILLQEQMSEAIGVELAE